MTDDCSVGVVVIGRNEGQRLRLCLLSPDLRTLPVVYVDSGSADNSVALARSLGVETLQLASERKFTAARARNAGLHWLLKRDPDIAFVQFVDADASLEPGWIAAGKDFLRQRPQVAAVCGYLRERHPRASIYNRLCDKEWDTPVGDVPACGGIALYRVSALRAEDGFREDLIAGEEPDLCFRLRKSGWNVRKLPIEMALHDAAMTSARQWWIRNKRSGYAIAQAIALRGRDEPSLMRQAASNLFWSIPLVWPLWPWLWWRVARNRGPAYASHIVFGKIPHLQGQFAFLLDRLFHRLGDLIEHK